MGFLQIVVIMLFVVIYIMALSKHGKLRVDKDGKEAVVADVLITMLIIHGLYYWGDFYATFYYPQAILLGWDSVLTGLVGVLAGKQRRYNAFMTLFDAGLTFSCLYAGGFFSHGVPKNLTSLF